MTRERRIPPPDRNALRTQSLILRTPGFFLLPLLLLFALFLLLRGHNAPGGGFIAGLVASAAIAVHLFAMSEAGARRVLRVDPRDLIAWGLILALAAGVIGLFSGQPFLTAHWLTVSLPVFGELKLGSPLLFDLGVFLVVLGTASTIIINLAEQDT
ncbi:MAG: Na+/H+ antiporter subunit B [Alcanivorax sp.]|nr:Na+/H+ antiporter subunit B [Alcanivorax sp.]